MEKQRNEIRQEVRVLLDLLAAQIMYVPMQVSVLPRHCDYISQF